MDKNEILAKSRNENKKQDEYILEIRTKAMRVGMIAVVIIIALLYAIEVGLGKEINYGYGVILSGINFAVNLYNGIKLKDKTYITCAVIWGVGTVAAFVTYIVNLVG